MRLGGRCHNDRRNRIFDMFAILRFGMTDPSDSWVGIRFCTQRHEPTTWRAQKTRGCRRSKSHQPEFDRVFRNTINSCFFPSFLAFPPPHAREVGFCSSQQLSVKSRAKSIFVGVETHEVLKSEIILSSLHTAHQFPFSIPSITYDSSKL